MRWDKSIRDFGEVLFLGHANPKPGIFFKSNLFSPKGKTNRRRASLLTKVQSGHFQTIRFLRCQCISYRKVLTS